MASPKLCDVSSRYGAPMGRPAFRPADKSMPLKFHLQRVRIDNGGYDSGGAYWGHGEQLYWACSVEEVETSMWVPGRQEVSTVELYARACDREDAKTAVRTQYPNATFFN